MNEQSKNEKKESLNLKKQENLIKEKKLSDKDKNTQKKVKDNQGSVVDEHVEGLALPHRACMCPVCRAAAGALQACDTTTHNPSGRSGK